MTEPSVENEAQLPIATDEGTVRCCGLTKRLSHPLMLMGMTSLTLLSVAAASYFAGKKSQPSIVFPPIDATASAISDKYSMATGLIGDGTEGLFVLDHNSGLLQCNVMYPRIGRFMGQFTVNVADALASGGKGGNYIMATGMANFPTSSNNPAAPSVIYVLDTATGNWVCYGIPFNRVMMNAGKAQQGGLVVIHAGTANPISDRE